MFERLLLVDFENVQAVDLSQVPDDAHVRLVLGMKQIKLPTELALQAQSMGDRFAYVPIRGQQPNAVDFCVAFYLGEYLTKNPHAECVILSKDRKGFDPLIAHLTVERGLRVRRVNAQKDAFPAAPPVRARKDAYSRVVELLGKEKSRPLKWSGLEGKIKSYCPKSSGDERQALLEKLMRDGKVSQVDGELKYSL